jgi:dipeptidyl aminopeptidase/acylaminoacyl peptidase
VATDGGDEYAMINDETTNCLLAAGGRLPAAGRSIANFGQAASGRRKAASRQQAVLLLFLSAPTLGAQSVTAADYSRAERFLMDSVTPYVSGLGIQPLWLSGNRVAYRNPARGTNGIVLVDPARGTRVACSPDTDRCGGALDPREVSRLQPPTQRGPSGRPESISPDGNRAAFIRDYNLWVRDVVSGRETQLTTDGQKDYGYATDNAGWVRSDRPVLVWSPDSRQIATFQQDDRRVGEMYLIRTRVGHPELQAWKYPLPGDSAISMIQRVVIDVDAPKVIRLQMPPDPHRSTLCDHVVCRGSANWVDVEWYPDGSHVAFVSTSRDHKHEVLRVADAATGVVRDVLREDVATQFESGNGTVNWHVLPASNEVVWFSERDDWGQLYLYDLGTGALKSKITSGHGNVAQVRRIDERTRTIYFVGNGKEQGWDPYYRQFYSIGMDGKDLKLLTPENADHDISLAPSANYFVDTYSRPDQPPVTVLRDLTGKTLLTLERADISRLQARGWKPPTPITVKARDGKTELYGLMYLPTNLNRRRKYPIVNHIYPGPQTGSVGGRSFSPARGDAQALAELGFVVVEIDGMGTPWRSKSFHDAYFGRMGDNTLPDQVAAMRELATRYPFIDINRAGIYGHSGGGFAAADAMFRYPDFFKVGISEAGNHDQRNYEDDWGERYQGLLARTGESDNYASEANQTYAKNLKGKLLLAHGTIDDNVPPSNTMLVVDALIAANKDFDLLLLPNRTHGFGNEPYMVRRRWDYFVKNLLGVEPPKQYEIRAGRR